MYLRGDNMKISTKGRYAVTIMVELAKAYKEDNYVSLNDIAEKNNISVKYLEKIMINLKKQDFFISSRGGSGGYKLSRKPSEYKIGEIIRAAEEIIDVAPCTNNVICPRKTSCTSFPLWKELSEVINDYLDSKTLEDYI